MHAGYGGPRLYSSTGELEVGDTQSPGACWSTAEHLRTALQHQALAPRASKQTHELSQTTHKEGKRGVRSEGRRESTTERKKCVRIPKQKHLGDPAARELRISQAVF